MFAFLLLLASALFVQAPVLSNQNGTITGILRTAAGAPAVGVRVSALARPEALKDLAAAAVFAGLGETDAAGRYRLENIPPGRYYIVAGRVDAPTYYPGTVQVAEGILVSVAPGLAVSGIDFVLNNVSIGRANASLSGTPAPVVSIQTRIEGGGKMPLFAGGRFPMLRFSRPPGSPIDVTLNSPNVTLQYPDYRVSVESLPDGYALKSVMFGAVDLKTNALQLPASVGVPIVPVAQGITVVLTVAPAPPTAGARVSGRIVGDPKRAIYISGNPGAVFSDGSFEFVGVPPGIHTIVTLDNPGAARPLGVNLAVGEGNLADIELDEIAIAPADSDRPTPPAPAGNRLPGSRMQTVSMRGQVVDGDTHEPFNAGKIVLNGNYAITFPLDGNGRFEVPKLLPGRYALEAAVYGIGVITRDIVLGEQDATLELSIAASR